MVEDDAQYVRITEQALALAARMAEQAVEVCAGPDKQLDPKNLIVCMISQLLRVANDDLEFPPEVVLSMAKLTLKDMGYEFDNDWHPVVVDLRQADKEGVN